jgi:hypothetical protein
MLATRFGPKKAIFRQHTLLIRRSIAQYACQYHFTEVIIIIIIIISSSSSSGGGGGGDGSTRNTLTRNTHT